MAPDPGGESVHRKIFLTFPQTLIKEPIIYTIGRKFDVIPNIRGASVTDEIGLVALELVGKPDEVEKAVDYIRGLGVKVESVSDDDPLPK